MGKTRRENVQTGIIGCPDLFEQVAFSLGQEQPRGFLRFHGLDPKIESCGSLGVQIDEQGALFEGGSAIRQVHGCCGFPDTALYAVTRDYFHYAVSGNWMAAR